MHKIGITENSLDFLNSYLEPRIGRVSVEGAFSDCFDLCNMIFQGTVLGPPLWNVFFHDVINAAEKFGAYASIFADDLNAFQNFDTKLSNADVRYHMQKTRIEVHKWGQTNRVTFENSKEAIVIIHPKFGEDDNF